MNRAAPRLPWPAPTSARPAWALAAALTWTLALALASAPTAAAQTSPAQSILAANPDSALTAVLAELPGQRLLLADAIAQAAQAAAVGRIAAADLVAAQQAVRREKGSFDPELFGRAGWSGADTPSASLFAGADVLETETTDLTGGARILLPIGTELSASLNSLRTTSNSDFAALDPEYQAYGALTLRQPLLAGFGPSTRADLAAAEQNLAGAGALYDAAQLAVRAEVEITYWSLYAAERNHAVTRLIRDRAAAFLEDTRLRAKAGMIGPSQVANAEFFLTEAERAVLDTEDELDRHSDHLASLTGRRPDPGQVRYRSFDDPPRDFPPVDADRLVAVASERNPDLEVLARNADAVRAYERGAVWDARPTLDLVGAIGGNGLAGTAQDVYFPGSSTPVRTDISGSAGASVDQVFGGDYPTWNVGLVFALPLGNRAGKGERDRLRAEVVRAEQLLLGARRTFEEDVRAQHRDLARGRQRLQIAERGVAASFRQVEIGMIDYRNGRTTAFEVVRLAADLARAQQSYSDALVRTARAAAILRQLTGGWYPESRTEEN